MYTAEGNFDCNEDSNKDTIEHFRYSTPYYYAYYAPYNPPARASYSSYGTYDAGYHARYGKH